MTLGTGLAIASLALQLVLVGGLVLIWLRLRTALSGETTKQAIQQEIGGLERSLDGRVDLILARLRDGAGESGGDLEDEETPKRDSSSPETAELWIPPPTLRPKFPGARGLSETEHLDLLLSSADFTSGVWPRMDGPFHVASALLLGFLAGQGVAEPLVEPHPPTAQDYPNHWDFLLLWSPDGGDEGRRFLIPRNFSRYDPAIHDSFFRVLGGGPTLDNFIRELRECARLTGSGTIEGLISPRLVEKKGVLVV